MSVSNVKAHWENIYTTKATDQVSWYRPHLEISLPLIERAAAGLLATIIDVGGGESTLVDDLLAQSYQNVTVLDISQTAIDVNEETSERTCWTR
jgi:2-polyprenyl-3-methyl-5-hydroxy-6-metoxy-1,4-benzoquinol methylase